MADGGTQTAATDKATVLRGNLAMLVTVLVWGSQRPITDLLLRDFDAWQLSLWRNWFAFPFMILLFAIPLFRGWKIPEIGKWKLFRYLMILGFLSSVGFGVLNTFGVDFAGPIQTSILGCATPIIAAIVAWIIRGTRPEKGVGIALIFVVGGALVAVFGGDRDFSDDSDRTVTALITGGVLIILATSCWQVYSIKAQDWLKGWGQRQITGAPMCLGAIQLTLICWFFSGFNVTEFPPPVPKDATTAGLFFYVAMGSIIIGTVAWNYGVKALGSVVAAIYLNLAPVVSIALAVAMGATLHVEEVVGAVLIVAGVAFTQRKLWRRNQPGLD